MLNVREGTFETNSSSAHNIVVVEDSQLEKWKNGEIFYVEDGNKFVSRYEKENYDNGLLGQLVLEHANDNVYQEEICEAIKENRLKEYVEEMINDDILYVDSYERPLSFREWKSVWDNRELEQDHTTYTTPNGEKIHIYCQYGYDG